MNDRRSTRTELLERACSGDSEAFEALVEPLAPRLVLFLERRARSVVAADCDAEDLYQRLLTLAWEKLERFEDRGPGSLQRWLVTLGRRLVNDRVRYVRADHRVGFQALEAGLEAPDPATSIGTRITRREEASRLADLLSRLPEGQRIVLERHLLEARTLAEIASELGISRSAVWERLSRGLATLRSSLEGRP